MVKGNVSYRKTDSGSEAPEFIRKYIVHFDKTVNELKNSDRALAELIENFQSIAHKHDNKELLNKITAARMALWDKTATYESFEKFVREALYGIVNQFRDIYRSVGIVFYDGGYASMEYEGGARLDGGAYNDTPSGVEVDGGDGLQRELDTITICSSEQIHDFFKEEIENG